MRGSRFTWPSGKKDPSRVWAGFVLMLYVDSAGKLEFLALKDGRFIEVLWRRQKGRVSLLYARRERAGFW